MHYLANKLSELKPMVTTKDSLSEAVCAIIVAYNPDLPDLDKLIVSLTLQVHSIVIINNTESSCLSEWVEKQHVDNMKLIDLGVNKGVSAAHNYGVDWAKNQGYGYVLLLDQDSYAADSMVDHLLTAHEKLTTLGHNVAAVGPNFVDVRSNQPAGFIRMHGMKLKHIQCTQPKSCQYHHAEYLITSGSLVSIHTLTQVGPFDESLFIDYVDIEWGLRANGLGYKSFGVCSTNLYHRLGDFLITLPWRTIPCRSPLRHYYAFRNAVLLYKRPYVPVGWKVHDAFRLILKFIFYSLFAKPRFTQFKMMSKGLIHGLLGKNGKFEEVLVRDAPA